MRRLFAFNVVVLSASLVASALGAGDDGKKDAPITAKAAFDRLKTMAGDWKNLGTPCNEEGNDQVQYKVTGAGSALVETSSPGTKMEMISVYHLDGDDLKMTHYCAAQNQPRLKLDRAASKPDHLVFTFDGGSNIDKEKGLYVSGLVLDFQSDSRVKADWQSTQGAKNERMAFELTRETK